MLLMTDMITMDDFCTSFSSIWTIVGYVLFAIKVVVPIILIVTGMITLANAVIGAKEDDITKCKGILVKKVIYALAVFLTIQIVGIIIGMVSEKTVYQKCAQCAFKPFSSGCYVVKDDSYVENPTVSPRGEDNDDTTTPIDNSNDNKSDDKKSDDKKTNDNESEVKEPVKTVIIIDDDSDEDKDDKDDETIVPTLEKIVPAKENVTIVLGGKVKKLTHTLVPATIASADITYSSSDKSIVTVGNDGTLTAKKEGKAIVTLTSGNVKATVNITVKKKEEDAIVNNANPVDIYFLNTQINKANNEAIIMKTRDDKYVLLDTANNKESMKNVIYNKLKSLQDSDKVVIDYMIISHLHKDHSGGAARIINDPNITVKNLIYKNEKFNAGNASSFLDAARNNNVNVYSQFTSEGSSVKVGSYLTLQFYNVSDVFASFNDCGSGYLGVGFVNDSNYASKFDVNGTMKYVYVDGKEYASGVYKYHVTDKLESSSGSAFNQRFYAYIRSDSDDDDVKNCSSNGNSFGVLATISTDNGNKYAYFANDIENVGYSIMPEGNKKISGPMMFSRAYATSGADKSAIKFSEKDNDFAPLSSANHKVASETNVANSINKAIDSSKIVIYQTSHHGYNDSPDAVNILNLNRKGVYAISNTNQDLKNYGSFLTLRSYYSTLGNATRLTTGSGNGIECNIKKDGSTSCKNN